MNTFTYTLRFCSLSILSLTLYLTSTAALAVPSYARQTGMACGACHTVYPELTAVGRSFKLGGYTLANMKQIETVTGKDVLKINEVPPLSAMLQTGFTHLNKQAPGKQNDDVQFPQQLSFYFAGEISPHMGSFLQVTYEQEEGSIGFDMGDVRYANHTTVANHNLLYGVSLNNAPGMEDVWNTTPSWTYPYTSSVTAPTPTADPVVNGLMNVAGLGAYALWDDHWYGTLTAYRSAPQGQQAGGTLQEGSLDNITPYGRFAWQGYFSNQGYLEIGTYFLHTKFNQGMSGNGAVGKSDKYTDLALDASYQQPLGDNHLLSMHAVYINEKQKLDSSAAAGLSSNPNKTLEQVRVDASYEYGHRGQIALGYFNTWGDRDLSYYQTTLGDVDNSISGNPDSAAFLAEVDYLPWENTKFSIQYTGYTKFNGSSNDYNGNGRSASDNNTLYLNTWFMW